MPLEIEKKENGGQYHVGKLNPGQESVLTHTQEDGSEVVYRFRCKSDDSRTTFYVSKPNSRRFRKLLVLEKGESFERPIRLGRIMQIVFSQR